jgi:hypothetical protein
MKFFEKILAAIGHLFTNLMKEAERVYKQLPEDVQTSIEHGSAIVAVINSLLTSAPQEIIDALQKKYPAISITQLTATVFDILKQLNITQVGSLEEGIAELQKHLIRAQENKVWEGVSFGLSGLFAILFAPAGTKFAVISQVLEVVYHKYVKPKVQAA